MAYYDPLIAKWATAPAGTTEQKLTWINAETVDGPPLEMVIPTYKLYNLIERAEFTALDAAHQQSVRDIILMGTVDATLGTETRKQMVLIFPDGTDTHANLSEFAADYDTPQVPWATAPLPEGGGLSSPVSHSDLEAAGLS